MAFLEWMPLKAPRETLVLRELLASQVTGARTVKTDNRELRANKVLPESPSRVKPETKENREKLENRVFKDLPELTVSPSKESPEPKGKRESTASLVSRASRETKDHKDQPGKLVPKVLLENQVYQAKTELTDKTEILVPLENPVSVELPESQEIMVPMDSTA